MIKKIKLSRTLKRNSPECAMRTHGVQVVCFQFYAGASFCQKKKHTEEPKFISIFFFLGRIETSFRKGATIDQKCGT